MSLINDVLKDLERRDAAAPAAASTAASGRRRSGVLAGSRTWPLWFLAALALGVILHLSLDGRASETRPGKTQALTAQAAPPQAAVGPSAAGPSTAATSTRAGDKSAQMSNPQEAVPVDTRPQGSAPEERPLREKQEKADVEELDQREESGNTSASTEREMGDPLPTYSAAAAPQQDKSPTERQASISIQRADPGQDQADPLADAKRLLSRGQIERAEASLRQIVAEQPEETEAHRLLATVLIRRGRHEGAVRALESGLARASDPAPLAALLGRLLIEHGDATRARSVLETHAPAISGDPDYHLLLAAAHRQAGDHTEAADHYRRLAKQMPRRAAVWIGLGASLESLARPLEAIEAYNRALDGDDERAARFARERLAALEPITGEPQ